ncbi:FtsB family cell division protein [Oecophyllibacter saccharovorans]|uniref:Septation inhibitor protein n=1 Tax=Oecophyllibacter saccharovorans TaxID=2558360 RepID=A0A506US42_9PROT|nr:septum formation initiator family protein [Oecophyllibacter saccharovorans]QDH16121.1 septation inhibitor protein [Oecophyllibacter saccharovorans]TPW35294.1 septation inhibitor protein [Oecophyllibacter saccharovorans]TPW36132.1 septation inhibitor protein [Oecophyllibacter saccharovorans]
MKVGVIIRRGLQAILPPLIFLLLTGYFIWNALRGEHGIQAYQEQLTLRQQAETALKNAHQEQDIWRRRVAELSEQSLDRDILDERSRAMLNTSQSDEIIVPYGDHDHLY